jgi:hypothetical protein
LGPGLAAASVRRVELDGRVLTTAELGQSLAVDPGSHRIRAEAKGGEAASKTFRVSEGEAATVGVDLPAARRASDSAWAWGALSLGGAGVVTGVATGIVALNARSSAAEACDQSACLEGTRGARDVERFRDFRTVSTIGYAVGALGLGVGTYLMLRLPRESSVVQLTVSAHRGGLEVGGAF